MDKGLKGFFREHAYGLMLGSAMSVVVGVMLHGAWKEDQRHEAFIDKLSELDVTSYVCPSTHKIKTSLAHTLVPLMSIEDRTLNKSGEDMLRGAVSGGVKFAFCTLAAGTTSFEDGAQTPAQVFRILKINDGATAQEQQAAILQFLKEYETIRVNTSYNAVVHADAGLARAMPGRIPVQTSVHDYKADSVRTLNIPSR